MIPCFVLVLDVLLISDRLTLYYLVISSICSFQGTSLLLFDQQRHKRMSSFIQLWIKYLYKSGSLLLSRAVSSQVSSAVRVLTIVFGMGTGVSPGRIATGIILFF